MSEKNMYATSSKHCKIGMSIKYRSTYPTGTTVGNVQRQKNIGVYQKIYSANAPAVPNLPKRPEKT
eukprot:15185972-Ditylum_brightwellii.AAC.1